jgi:hypothetical protein
VPWVENFDLTECDICWRFIWTNTVKIFSLASELVVDFLNRTCPWKTCSYDNLKWRPCTVRVNLALLHKWHQFSLYEILLPVVSALRNSLPLERETYTLHWTGAQETISTILKVPRQCPTVLLVEVMHMMGIIFYWCWKGCIIVKFLLTLGGLH